MRSRHYARWTDEEDEMAARLYRAGCSVDYIAKVLDRNPPAIYSRARQRRELYGSRYFKPKSRRYAEAVKMWERGMLGKQIASELGISLEQLWYLTRHHREDFPRRHTDYGSEWEAEAAALRKDGMRFCDIGERLGVNRYVVARRLHEADID